MSGFLTDFQNIFRASCPIDYLFRVMVDRIDRVFNDTGATWADISRGVLTTVLKIYDGAFLRKLLMTLTHFQPILIFYTPWKHEKTFVFLAFQGV